MRLALKTSLMVAIAALASTLVADYAHAQARDAASKARGGWELYGGGRRSYRSYSYAPRARSYAPAIVTEQAVTTTTPTEAATADAGATAKKPQTAKKPETTKKPEVARAPQTETAPTAVDSNVARTPRRSYRSYSYDSSRGPLLNEGVGASNRGYAGRVFDAGRKIRGH
ncbi:MAG: hypothetical protein AB7U73_16730 [Pirellulales bacterium]